ncbi:MAG: antitoxin family protein [Tepidisphaeraceae bacterium]|jgi:predicted DNA-binding antitoxin AbrB/MazE fold protein
MTVKAIYENGLFRPIKPVKLPENAEVEIVLPEELATEDIVRRDQGREAIMEILSRRFRSGQTDLAARHNEHQP